MGILPGSSSQAVKFLQQMLNIIRVNKGRSPIAADGVYGNATKAAVAEFQEEWESIAGFHRLINLDLAKNGGAADYDTLRAIAIAVNLIMGE
jgi:lysozyme family protein